MKRLLLAAAALVAAVAVFAALSRPPRRLALPTSWSDGAVPGVLHVHTNRSDGRSSPDEVAAAAARVGLKFLIFTDHGDGTRTPDPPAYRSGVLCLDGVEVSTSGGHYVVIDMPASPYPLAGEARDVVEDVRRFGGFGIAAHPDSPKRELRWSDWNAPVDGVELINPDTSWRVHAVQPGVRPKLGLAHALLTYPLEPGETIAALLTGSPLEAWTRLSANRRVVALAGVDAHAKLELKNVDPGDNRYSVPLPSYAASFDVLSVRVRPAAPLTGDAASDARALVSAIRGGHLYTAVDAWAEPPAFELSASNSRGAAQGGDELPPGGATTLHVRSNAPAGFVTSVWNGLQKLDERREQDFTVDVGSEPGAYRVEIREPSREAGPAWVTSNPIYVRAPQPSTERVNEAPAAARREPLFDGRTLIRWNTEADPTSQAAIDVAPRVNGNELRLRFALSGGSDVGQFAAATVDTPQGVADFDRVTFSIRAERPMRVSVQVRAEVPGSQPERWHRSVYVDDDERARWVSFADMTPVGETHAAKVPQSGVRTIMFLIETPSTKPGVSGRMWIRDPRLER